MPFVLLTLALLPTGEPVTLVHAPAPADNPLMGLVPYDTAEHKDFPHSLEFLDLPLSDVASGPVRHDWRPLDRRLDAIAGRGHQAVVRFWLEYPGRAGGLPRRLTDAGVRLTEWTYSGDGPRQRVATPDYADPRLRRTLREFVAALGERYDGDPRLGYLQAGLLGLWGEWHDWPREELFAPVAVQREVLDAYEAAFDGTPVLLRYPVGPDDGSRAANASRPFGYHDDSFAWATLDTGREEDDWFYLAALKAAGPDAQGKWRTRPIGGEIRPELWGRIFDEMPPKRGQDFAECVRRTHVTWLMDSGMFRKDVPADRRDRAIAAVRRMGYELHVAQVTAEPNGDMLDVTAAVANRGVAPFYRPWPIELALLADDGTLHARTVGRGTVDGILPGDSRTWRESLPLADVPAGRCRVLLRVPNPLPGGKPLRFANATQDAHRDGWLTLTFVRRDR